MKTFSRFLVGFWALLLLGNGWILWQSRQGLPLARLPAYRAKQQIAQRFLLTDYCLSTESRHVRHISLPEPIAPFQDLPAYHEHFPSSSFLWADLPQKRGAGRK